MKKMEPSQSSNSGVIHLCLPQGMPTLGLVGSNGKVESPAGSKKKEDEQKIEKTPCLVAVSAMECDGHGEGDKKDEQGKSVATEGSSQPGSEQELSSSKRPRLTTTLLIFKQPSQNGESYAIANPQKVSEDEEMGDEDETRKKKKKKKKKKSKERVLSMSRSYAQTLVEMQKSMKKLTTRYRPDPVDDGIDRRRRTQSLSALYSLHEPSIKSPPLSAPVIGPMSAFSSYKRMKSIYRRRQISSGSNIDATKRRFTRKKRWESEEASGFSTPTSESAKKNHLSENNVWTPMDDYRLLINSVQTKGNLEHVFAGTKFSCFYTFDEVAHRWETLLYDEKAGILSQNAISNLHPVLKAKIQSEALFSEEEEDLLRNIKLTSGGSPDVNTFTKLLDENPNVFQHRTARKLFQHWTDMKNYHLLDGQDVRDYKDPFSLFEFQDGAFLASVPEMSIHQELVAESKLVKRQIKQLEDEIESWHCMQELVVSDGTSDLHTIFSPSEFDDQTYAILKGKQVRYCMRSKEILLGRHSTNNKVDADLTLEGASGKVSRRQAVIQIREFGEFYIINQGRHSIFVDHLHVPYGAMAKLNDGCVIQITHIKLIFKVNEKLMRKEMSHEIKREVINARFASFDSFASPSFPGSSSAARSSLNLGSDGTSKFPSPRKRNSSSTSANTSPATGLGKTGSPFAMRSAGGSRHIMGSPSNLLGPMFPLPFSSSDLTIRPTSQPNSLHYPFTTGPYQRPYLPGPPVSSDNDVFKKPAPVPVVRMTSKQSPAKASPSPTVTSSSLLPSAFASFMGSTQLVPPIITTASSNGVLEPASTNVLQNICSTAPANLPPVSQLMDYTKLGLSPDVTVTPRSEPTKTASIPTVTFNSNSVDSANIQLATTVPVAIHQKGTLTSVGTPPPPKKDEVVGMPCLGLVTSTSTPSQPYLGLVTTSSMSSFVGSPVDEKVRRPSLGLVTTTTDPVAPTPSLSLVQVSPPKDVISTPSLGLVKMDCEPSTSAKNGPESNSSKEADCKNDNNGS